MEDRTPESDRIRVRPGSAVAMTHLRRPRATRYAPAKGGGPALSLLDLSDEDLVLRARDGDQKAIATLYDRHAGRLARLGRRHLFGGIRRREGESDLVQDALQAAFEDLDRYVPSGPGSFARWLDAILEHKAGDVVRRELRGRRSVRREAGSVSAVDPADSAPTPSSMAGRNERSAGLREAIARLEGNDRLIVSLVHERGMTFVEAGRVLGRSADAVRKQYARVVARLARQVDRGGAS
jgi:RNA polymerase sigma-70 factor (ECF subfamily)